MTRAAIFFLLSAVLVLPPVYHPGRLKPIRPTVSVSGTVVKVRVEKDGDAHVELWLDERQLLTGIIGEIVCVKPPKVSAAALACRGYTNHVRVPKVGEHIWMRGPFIYDSNHAWVEIHPVVEIWQ